MSFIIEINGNEITSIEDLKANFDIDILLNHRSNFDDWLFGWDYEDEAAQVRELSPDLSDDDWLKNVCKIIGIPSAKLTAAKRKRTSEAKKAAEAAEAAEAAAKAAAEEEEKKKKAHFANQDILMPIEDVFFIEGRGTVVTGRIERGIIKDNDEVDIVGIYDTVKTTVTGIEMFGKWLGQGEAGDNVGLLLPGVESEYVKRGQVLARPGSILPHTKFIADLYVFSKEEGGRCTPFYNNYRPQFYFRNTDVTGTVTLPEATDLVMPGDNVTLTIELVAPIAMEKGLSFYMREGGRKVASGTVVAIIK